MCLAYSNLKLYLIKAINVEGNTVIDIGHELNFFTVQSWGGIQMLTICVYSCRFSCQHYLIKISYLQVIQCYWIEYSFNVYNYISFNYEEIDRLFSYYSVNFFFFYVRPPPFLWNQFKERRNKMDIFDYKGRDFKEIKIDNNEKNILLESEKHLLKWRKKFIKYIKQITWEHIDY